MSLIDKTVLITKLAELDNRARVKAVRDLIDEMPELVEGIERKTGTWERMYFLRCSECGGEWDTAGGEEPQYCPMCGAKMEVSNG